MRLLLLHIQLLLQQWVVICIAMADVLLRSAFWVLAYGIRLRVALTVAEVVLLRVALTVYIYGER